jgi:hypothetical protein
MYEFAQGYAKVVVLLPLLILKQLGQAFCKPLQYLNVLKVSIPGVSCMTASLAREQDTFAQTTTE